MTEEGSGGKLHIDSDWKTEAAREKERLAEQETTDAASGAASGAPESTGFLELVNLLAMQAAISLGGYQGPGGERIPPNLAAAKHQIDLMAVLDEKTKGNLAEEEKRALDGVLYELRLQYVQLAGGGEGSAPGPQGA